MNHLKSQRRFITPFLLLSAGLGVSAWYGLALYELPRYSEPEIEVSVEANLAIDLARLGPHLQLDATGRERLRAQIRQEVKSEIARERREPQQGLAVGLACLLFGAASLALLRRP